MNRAGLSLVVLLAGCADAPPGTPDTVTETGTDRMVELLAQIAAGTDRQQNRYASSAPGEVVLARGPGPTRPGTVAVRPVGTLTSL